VKARESSRSGDGIMLKKGDHSVSSEPWK